MPIPIMAYRCKWKCGRRASTNKAGVTFHEEHTCPRNPATKACKTCRHNEVDRDFDGTTLFTYYTCAVGGLDYDKASDILGLGPARARMDCPLWESPCDQKKPTPAAECEAARDDSCDGPGGE